ncbi:hypothetical protein MHYP_G00122060 [Metynnis hypsauchen]
MGLCKARVKLHTAAEHGSPHQAGSERACLFVLPLKSNYSCFASPPFTKLLFIFPTILGLKRSPHSPPPFTTAHPSAAPSLKIRGNAEPRQPRHDKGSFASGPMHSGAMTTYTL